jgi:hypothetical protein
MKIDVTPYIQQALERITPQPLDLSAVRLSLGIDFQPDAINSALRLATTLTATEDAGLRFRAALRHAGLDDLRVFELGRAFDRLLEGLACT